MTRRHRNDPNGGGGSIASFPSLPELLNMLPGAASHRYWKHVSKAQRGSDDAKSGQTSATAIMQEGDGKPPPFVQEKPSKTRELGLVIVVIVAHC
ncbi:hypothetical protein MRX96_054946 [Rhipicephalus microplus]